MIKSGTTRIRFALVALGTVAALLGGPAAAAPVIEGMSSERGAALLERMSARIQQFIPGKLAVEEVDFVGPAPLGAGFYLVSARKGKLVALIDEPISNVILLAGYVSVADGRKHDVLATVRQKAGYAAAAAEPARRSSVLMHPAEAIPYFNGARVVHVICDPNSVECTRFHNEVLKRTPDVRAYIYPVSMVAPGNWREHSVRELLCWPQQLQFAQYDAIVNGANPAAAGVPGQPCLRDQAVDEMTARLRASGSVQSLPMITFPNGRSINGRGLSKEQFDKMLNGG